ncbi:MAG TPA: hypothetical protein VKT81_21655 [Bryobacteraceae bacterium]|nr:hypothetical protein [Bryobacteraceae bacterium]
MTPDVKTADTIDRYLLRFRMALAGVKDKEEFVSEIRSHIVERLEDHTRPMEQIVEETLAGLGAPEVLAMRYRTEGLLERASSTMSPVLLLRATMRWAMTGIRGFFAFWLLFVGYFTAAAFYICAILKPFFPDRVGLYWGPATYGIGVRMEGDPAPNELLGMWFSPIALALGCLCIIGTTKFVRWMISKRRRAGTVS